jgi:hypothetical protein
MLSLIPRVLILLVLLSLIPRVLILLVRGRGGPENLHLRQVPRWCWCWWSTNHTLRILRTVSVLRSEASRSSSPLALPYPQLCPNHRVLPFPLPSPSPLFCFSSSDTLAPFSDSVSQAVKQNGLFLEAWAAGAVIHRLLGWFLFIC